MRAENAKFRMATGTEATRSPRRRGPSAARVVGAVLAAVGLTAGDPVGAAEPAAAPGAAVSVAGSASPNQAPATSGETEESKAAEFAALAWRTLEGGRTKVADELRRKPFTVVLFLSTECPISQQYLPVVQGIVCDFSEKEVQWIGVFPNAAETAEGAKNHLEEYGWKGPARLDRGAKSADQWKVKVCPSACILDSTGALHYQGRIDDRFAKRGRAAAAPQEDTLRNALAAVLAGKRPAAASTEAVGCPIQRERLAPRAEGKAPAGATTYHRDVAKVLHAHCLECHRKGGAAPFALSGYEDALRWADDLADLAESGAMPPWKPAAGHGEFLSPRTMPAADQAVLRKWVDGGCLEGDPADAPAPPVFSDGWKLGEPDLVLSPREVYRLAATGDDVYRCFVLPTGLKEDSFVTALEVLPGNPRVVHHVLTFVDVEGRSSELDAADPGEGYSTQQGFPGFLPAGGLGGWAPGNRPRRLPAGMGRPLPREAKVVIQIHYHKTGKEELDQTKVGLYFSKTAVDRPVRALPVLPFAGPWGGMRIPAGAADHEVKASMTLPRDLLAVAVTPHMHLLGKQMKVDAVLPGGEVKPLVWIKDWDFNWQESYTFREPVLLPEGTRLEMSARYDNSAGNPRNPNRPPLDVRWGEGTNDEMAIAFVEMAPAAAGGAPPSWRPGARGGMFLEFLRAQQPAGSPLRDLLGSLEAGDAPQGGPSAASRGGAWGATPYPRRKIAEPPVAHPQQ